MHTNNITAEVLYSTRTLVSCSQRKSTFAAQSISFQAGHPNTARSRRPFVATPSVCFDTCYLRFAAPARWQALYMMRIGQNLESFSSSTSLDPV